MGLAQLQNPQNVIQKEGGKDEKLNFFSGEFFSVWRGERKREG